MILSPDLRNIIQEYISDFNNKKTDSCVVTPAVPIVWFGDIKAYNNSPKKIVTVGLNPSLEEFGEKRFNIVDLQQSNSADELADTLNLYFQFNPYKRWFNFFERVLSSIDASYYKNAATNTAIHIDIYSAIATDPTWGKLSNNEKQNIKRTDLFKKLLNFLDPDVMLVSVNQDVFNDVFYQFRPAKFVNDINGKKGIFIRKYKQNDKILISGRNMNGQPFGGLQGWEIQEVMADILHD